MNKNNQKIGSFDGHFSIDNRVLRLENFSETQGRTSMYPVLQISIFIKLVCVEGPTLMLS